MSGPMPNPSNSDLVGEARPEPLSEHQIQAIREKLATHPAVSWPVLTDFDSMAAIIDALAQQLEQAEQRKLKRLQAWVDAEKFDRQFGLHLPGDSALAVLLNEADETLAALTPDEGADLSQNTSEDPLSSDSD